jgi:alpha-tubulin suppressor-like RCC1 family protein
MADMIFSGVTFSGGFNVTIPGTSVPGAPTIGLATATGATTATVAFTAPASDGGSTITTYTATSSPGNITGTLSQAGSGTITVSGLTASTSYTFTVTATNSVGTGNASAASNSITTSAASSPPVNTVAPVVSGTASFGSTLSTTNGTWTGTATITFTYQWQRAGSNIGSATNSTYTLVAADVGNAIRCVVTGTNGVGNSSANSNATSAVVAIAPGAPTIGSATATGATTATVAFTAPASNGGATITTYTATSSPGNITGTLSQAGSGTINMTGLTASTSYTFTVTATNSIGTGSASAASNSITTSSPASAPGAPRFTASSVYNSTSILVSFVFPTSDGGSTITSYTATSSPGNITGTVNQAGSGQIIVTGLTTGTPYTFTVTATNSVGTGPASSPATDPQTPAATTQMYTSGGLNASYELGDQTTYQRSSPVLVNGGILTWASGVVFTGAQYPPGGQGLGIDSIGILYSWGLGNWGSSGQGPNTSSKYGFPQLNSVPEYVYFSLWSNVTTALDVSMGVTTAGRLFGWGRNDYKTTGCLGLNIINTDYINRGISSTTQVGTLTTWSTVRTSGTTSFAIKTDGTLWSMGNNYRGQLGLNSNSGNYQDGRSSPTQVGTDTNWSKVVGDQRSTIGLRTNGTLWAWGDDQYGTLGQNVIYINRSSPTQIGTDTNWSDVDIGNGSVIARRTNGTLWGWGNNSLGTLGLNDKVHRSSPVQLGSATDWAKASISLGDMSNGDTTVRGGSVVARKTTGTAWAWGTNAYGELGLGNTISRSSPIQIGSSTNWSNSGTGILMLTQ